MNYEWLSLTPRVPPMPPNFKGSENMTDWPFDTLKPVKYGAILADPP